MYFLSLPAPGEVGILATSPHGEMKQLFGRTHHEDSKDLISDDCFKFPPPPRA